MGETRKLAAILVSDVVGYSRLAGADEEGTLARLRALRSDLIDPAIAAHHGRIVKRTGDGSLIEFRSVVDAVRCAVEMRNGMVGRNAGVAEDRQILFRVGIHLGDVVEESDGDLMGDGVNIAARLEGVAQPGAICLSEDAYRQVKGRLDLAVSDLGPTQLKNITEPIRVYSLDVSAPAAARAAPVPPPKNPPRRAFRWSSCHSPISAAARSRSISSTGYGEPDDRSFADSGRGRDRPQYGVPVQRQASRREDDRARVECPLCPRRQRSARRNRMRVNVQVDAETGNHLWAERFDKPRLISSTCRTNRCASGGRANAQPAAAEARRAEKAPTPYSMDLYFQGLGLV